VINSSKDEVLHQSKWIRKCFINLIE
jgi:hypothetical protein